MNALMVATANGLLECPKCKSTITRTEDYQADIVTFPQIGGPPVQRVRSEAVTLRCTCGWSQRTNTWRNFLKGA